MKKADDRAWIQGSEKRMRNFFSDARQQRSTRNPATRPMMDAVGVGSETGLRKRLFPRVRVERRFGKQRDLAYGLRTIFPKSVAAKHRAHDCGQSRQDTPSPEAPQHRIPAIAQEYGASLRSNHGAVDRLAACIFRLQTNHTLKAQQVVERFDDLNVDIQIHATFPQKDFESNQIRQSGPCLPRIRDAQVVVAQRNVG